MTPRASCLWAGVACALAACSDSGGTDTNGVDVAAAASRAQSDIANYAAAGSAAQPRVRASPTARPTMPATEAVKAHADGSPDAVVRRYVQALSTRHYDEAWRLWDGGGGASGMTQDAFAASFAPYATYKAVVGKPGDADAGAGQRYVAVPVTVTGRLRSGEPFRLEGPIVVHKVADGIESDDPAAHAWRIRSSELKPRPATAASPAP